MVTKIHNLNAWTKWQEGRMLPLPKDKSRTVRIEFIAEQALAVRVLTEQEATDEGLGQLVLVMPQGGHETLEFAADGNILVSVTTAGELLFNCSENEQWWVEFEGEVSFTKPYERPLVDPAFQHMRLVMMQNMQAMEERMNAAVARRFAAEPPKAATVVQKEAKADDGDDSKPDGEDTGEADGEIPPARTKEPKKAPAGGGAVRAPASGEGG